MWSNADTNVTKKGTKESARTKLSHWRIRQHIPLNVIIYLQTDSVETHKTTMWPASITWSLKINKSLYNVKQIYLQIHIKMQQHPQTQMERFDEAPLSCLLDAAYFSIHQEKIKKWLSSAADKLYIQTIYKWVYNNQLFFFRTLFHNAVINLNYTALNDWSILKNEFQKIWNGITEATVLPFAWADYGRKHENPCLWPSAPWQRFKLGSHYANPHAMPEMM